MRPILKLGEAIRRGQETNVSDINENKIDIIVNDLLCKPGIKFELDLRRENNFDQREKCKIFVTPFHLAIISPEPKIDKCMLEAIKKHSKAPIASLRNLLSTKTDVEFAKGLPDMYCSDDRSLDGINAFHCDVHMSKALLHTAAQSPSPISFENPFASQYFGY